MFMLPQFWHGCHLGAWSMPKASQHPKQKVPALQPLACLVHRQDCSHRNTRCQLPWRQLVVLLCVITLQLEQSTRVWETLFQFSFQAKRMLSVLEHCPPHQASSCLVRLRLPDTGTEEEESPCCWDEGLGTLLFLMPRVALAHHSGAAVKAASFITPCKSTLAVTQTNREPRASPWEVSGPGAVQTHSPFLLYLLLPTVTSTVQDQECPSLGWPNSFGIDQKSRTLSPGSPDQFLSQLLPIHLFQLRFEREAGTLLHFRKPCFGCKGSEVSGASPQPEPRGARLKATFCLLVSTPL